MVHIRFSGTGITELNLHNNPKLAAVYCYNTGIKELDLSDNPEIFEIFCYNTEIRSLDLTGFPGLNSIECYDTPLESLDVSKNPNLTGLTCNNTEITSLDVSNNPNLRRLELANTAVTSLDISKNKQLRTLNISNTKIADLKNLDLSGYAALENLDCTNAGIETLKLPENQVLSSVKCGSNALTALDLSKICGLWWEKEVSPQTRTVYAEAKDGALVFDMNTVVSDVSRIAMKESKDVSYDAATGIMTIKSGAGTKVSYSYDHSYGYGGLDPMEVTLTVEEKKVVPDEGNNQTAVPGNPTLSDKPENDNVSGSDGDVRTGDEAPLALWLTLACASVAGIVFVIVLKKKKTIVFRR